jgi:hypothetical protein
MVPAQGSSGARLVRSPPDDYAGPMRTRSRQRVHRRARVLLGLALALGASQSAHPATSAEASLEVVVPAGSWKGVRLQGISANATLTAGVESDGTIAVALLDAEQFAAFPAGTKAVFRGRTDGKLRFEVRAPVRGDYYLIVDNRDGSEARTVQVAIRGEIAKLAPQGPLRSAPGT